MKANELRITNIVSFPIEKSGENSYYENSMIVKISQLYSSAFILGESNCKHFETIVPKIIPIVLTHEWLLKLGFSFQDDSFSIRNLFIVFFENRIECYFKDWAVGHLVKLKNIQYVHQLQNLYFSLTGEELEFIGNDGVS